MRRRRRGAARVAAQSVLVVTLAAEAVAGQARGNLAVTVRVIDRCRATTAAATVAQSCAGHAGALLPPAPSPAAAAPASAAPTVRADARYLTVVY